jgi:hypothetical protein
MAISVTHTLVSAKADGADATLVQPSDWNAAHTITCAANVLLGRTSGAGAVQELATSAFFQGLYSAADAAAFLTAAGFGAFTSGDVKMTLKTTADTGWVMMDDGTIGNGSSSATTRANADTEDLFEVLWAIDGAYAPIYTSAGVLSTRGGSAASDFAANRRLALTKTLGRALAVAGAGSGLTSRALGLTTGTETHTLTSAESGQKAISAAPVTITDPGHDHTQIGTNNQTGVGAGSGASDGASNNTGSSTTDITAAFTLAGSDAASAHANMQPTSFLNVMIKL